MAISAKIWQGQGIAASVRQHICYRYIIASKAVKFCSCLLCWSEHDLYLALRKNLCKNNQLQKNNFVLRVADRSLSFLFQYKLNTAVCQAPDAKYPDATERSAVRSGYFAAVSVQPVRIHYLKLTEHFAPVPKRHCPFFGYLRCCQIRSL